MPDTKRTASGVLGGFAGLIGLSAVAGVLITATVTPAIALSGAAATGAIDMFDNLPSVLDIEKLMLPTTLYAKNPDTGEYVEITQFYDQNRSPVVFEEIAPVMYDSILSSEDKNFYKHGGIDLVGTVSAVYDNLRGSDTRGGSSISQQYVKNILVQRCEQNAEEVTEEKDGETVVVMTQDEALQNCWLEATTATGTEGIQRKLQEMRYAIALEQKYSKNEILLGYLNIANFGGTTYGIDAAARYYFGVAAKDLSIGQAAALAGMVQNPNTYRIDKKDGSTVNSKDEPVNSEADGYALTKDRQVYVLARLLADGKITQEQHDAAVAEPITPKITPPKIGCAAGGASAYFCQYVKNIIKTDPAFGETDEDRQKALQRGGLNVYTTLDYRIQNPAVEAMHNTAPSAIAGMSFGGASVSIEVGTGRVLSMTQNTAFSEDRSITDVNPAYTSLVYAADKKYGSSIGFPAGSTFKIFTLVDWLEKGHSLNEVLNGRLRAIKRVANSCEGDWVNYKNERPNNFGTTGGFVGSPMRFTAASLNTGFFAMAEKLDLCDIKKVATKMGVTKGDGGEVTMDTLFSVIGSNNVAPIAMANAYATVASNGMYCQPKAIDRVTDSDGNDLPIPATTCTQVLDPKVAATAAYALQGVMKGSGTGTASNPFDGTPLLGKTGTNEDDQTWMVESSTKVATAVWIGNSTGKASLSRQWANGIQLNKMRHHIAPVIQRAANSFYPGGEFPQPDRELTRQVYTDLPNVVGLSVDEATRKLQDAGFDVTVGGAVDSDLAAGLVATQSPGAGRVAGGTPVTINPSNGQGVTMPSDVAGRPISEAISYLGALFPHVRPGVCTEDESVKGSGTATGTNPPGGSVVNRNTQVTVDYSSEHCN